jgi:hypothetical protein
VQLLALVVRVRPLTYNLIDERFFVSSFVVWVAPALRSCFCVDETSSCQPKPQTARSAAKEELAGVATQFYRVCKRKQSSEQLIHQEP